MIQFKLLRSLLLCAFCVGSAPALMAQVPADTASSEIKSDLDEVHRQLLEQQEELRGLRAALLEQSRVIDELRQRLEQGSQAAPLTVADPKQTASSTGQAQETDARLARVEEQVKKTDEKISSRFGSISFSGDVRLRYESIYGQLNTLANAANPAVVGNELSPRQRFRLRARLSLRGQLSKELDWGIRLASGSFADGIATTQTFTDFFNRKPFGLDNAYLAYSPKSVPGLRLQGGKFEVPWLRTELTIDNDLQPEGFSETYSRSFKKSALKNLTFVAWQLPFLERNSAFVRNADGTVNLDESRRAGRDLALYGAQVRARLEPNAKIGLTLALTNLSYSGTQYITPIQFFGNLLQLPLTVTLPATATSPAQTITTQVSIPRELLATGNVNLGVSTASTNAVNRDGRLSSGFNLIDFIGRLDLAASRRFPVALIFDFVTNTQAHDVVTAGPGGADLLLPNHENNGYWAEIQVGRQKEKNDLLLGYTFMRIEKDAVLTPFNFSELAQQSDMRAHRFAIHYTPDPRVLLSVIGIFTERPNGLLGVFGSTPPGSLNSPTKRLHLETTFRF